MSSQPLDYFSVADQFVTELATTQQLGPCTRLTFACADADDKITIVKLVIPTANLRAIGEHLLSIDGKGPCRLLANFGTEGQAVQ